MTIYTDVCPGCDKAVQTEPSELNRRKKKKNIIAIHSHLGPPGTARVFDPNGERVWKWKDAVICMQREREREGSRGAAESLLIFQAMS